MSISNLQSATWLNAQLKTLKVEDIDVYEYMEAENLRVRTGATFDDDVAIGGVLSIGSDVSGYKLPYIKGNAGQILALADNSGNLQWTNNGGGTGGDVNSVSSSNFNINVNPSIGNVVISLNDTINISQLNTTNFKLNDMTFSNLPPADGSILLYSAESNEWVPSSQSDAFIGNYTNANISVNLDGRITSISNGQAPINYTASSPISILNNNISLNSNIDLSGITTDTLNVNTFKNIFDTNPT